MRNYSNGQKDYTPLGVHSTSNYGGLVVLAINNGFNDTITSAFDYGEGLQGIRTTCVHYTPLGRPYIIRYQQAYYLDEIMRVQA